MARSDVPKTTPKSRRRRVELLIAARATFERLGYFDTRAADIAAAAEVSYGTFYTYFDSKDDVLRVLLDELVDDLMSTLRPSVPSGAAPFEALESTIRSFMYAYRDRAPMIRVLEQATASNAEFLAIRLGIRERFGRQIEAALAVHLTDEPDDALHLAPPLGAYALGGMVEDFARGCYLFGQLVDDEEAIAALAVVWARAVGLTGKTRH